MSETIFQEGRIREVVIEQKTFKDKIEQISKNYEIPVEDLVDDINDEWIDHDMFVFVDNKVFEILEDNQIDENDDICEVKEIDKNEYSFRLRYYNGGTSMSEMLKEGLNKLK